MNVTVIGTGYVGLVTGVCLAHIGHQVTCLDVNLEKISLMREGKSPIYEKDLETLMHQNKTRLTYTTDYKLAYSQADVIFIAVGTPSNPDGSANLTYIYEVADQLATHLDHDCLIVLKSTVPIGTTLQLHTYLLQHLLHPIHLEVAFNPEFLAQGRAVKDTLTASRIVIGTESESAQKQLTELYCRFNAPIVYTNWASAELIKYASNNFLALKISYINEVANLCERIGADIEDVATGMGLDPRIGKHFLQAGIGYGGSCFPKDTKALYHLTKQLDEAFRTLKATIDTNEAQVLRLINRIPTYYPSYKDLTIAILGLTFKPDTDDLRDAPSLSNVKFLLQQGATLRAYDPVGMPNYQKIYPKEITYCSSIKHAIKDADLCLIFTEWQEIKSFDVSQFALLMKKAIILDGRNCYTLSQFKDLPVVYSSIGRTTLNQL